MITKKELNEVTLSPTKKDYYQIWNELLDLASKISSRWTPANTNESDPGIVLLKALTAIADKLNYNIDKNTLEAFMPSATQEESMRKLTEMLGYSMKYYQAATCSVSFSFKETEEHSLSDYAEGIWFPRFLNLTNEDEDINYVTLESFNLSSGQPIYKVKAIEGELVTCESDTDNVVSLKHLDDLNRYILPEAAVAENGIFICNVSNNQEEEMWERVDNLNDKFLGSRIFKFGFDSSIKLPYIQFPEDISHLINSGLKIQYIRTRGIDGNISSETISKFIIPAEWSELTSDNEEDAAIKELSSDNFNVKNITSAINGADPESIDQAYNNYKKVIGTFNTLVTCRDYMNKIYQLMDGENSNTPLVSNIIAADIRDDINKAITLCSFNDYGICYSNEALSDASGNKLIDHCDLILYPFKTIYNKNEKREYINSFKLDTSNNDKIYSELSEIKSLAHNFMVPSSDDIVCIKNYLKLKAQIYTKKKVTINEGQEIIQNIKNNLYYKFNMRQLDFGEEIPYEHIYEAMLNADTRIRDIILDEPTLNTKILTGDNNEYDLVSLNDSNNKDKALYNKLVLRNVLAGRIAAFSYYNNTLNDFRDKPYAGSLNHVDPNVEGAVKVDTTDPDDSYYSVDYSSSNCASDSSKYIHKLIAKFEPDCTNTKPLKLEENQVIQFSMPNLKTTITYPAYVNYYFIKSNKNSIQRWYPATLWSIYDYIKANKTNTNLTDFLNSVPVTKTTTLSINKNTLPSDKTFIDWIREQEEKYGTIIKYKVDSVEQTTEYDEFNFETAELCEVYVLDLTSDTLSIWSDFIKETLLLKGIYKNNGVDLKKTPGYLIDSSKISYSEITTINTNYADGNLKHFYIPIPHDTDEAEQYTIDGLGRNGGNPGISTKTAYQLQEGDYLFINYSDSSDAESDAKTVINKVYTAGTIIKPNFELADSEIYHNSHSYSKKDNFNFDAYNSQVPGMFTLGTNEQIEIQEIEKVELDGIANLYWTLNSDKADHTSSTFYFTEQYFDNNILESKFGSINNAYMLKEGEYLYYTDAKKNDLAYYGAGTWVVKNFGWGEDNLVRDNNNNITIEDVEENGIGASIPWTTFNLSKQDNKNIFIIGTQIITLTEGDTLEFISKTAGLTDLAENNCIFDLNSGLTDTWVKVGSAKYKFAENETSQLLPTTAIDNISWHARSRLDLSMNEGYPQTLHHGDSITVKFKNCIDDTDSTDPDVIIAPKYVKAANPSDTSDFIGVPLVLQPNRLVQSAVGEAIVSSGAEITAEGTTDTILRDFVLKVTQRDELITKTNNILQLNNYVNNNNYFTKYSFSGEPALNGHVYSVNKDDIYKFEIMNGDETSEYYLCGKFTNWQTVDKYKLSITDKEQNNRLLSANTKFSIIKKSNSNYSTLVKDSEFLISTSGTLESDTVVEVENNQADFNLQINIPTDTFGTVMFYWIYDQSLYNSDGSDKKIKAEAKIEAIDADETATEHISLFNSNIKSSSINLNRGFNMIQIDPEVKQLKIYGTCGNIIFDNLRIITGINPALNYQAIDKPNALNQMLSDIAAIPEAAKFYCTAPIMSDTAIDLNQSIESDNFLDNALSWYDVNNINNKFVISEIDADFLNTGLSIAKTSRV